MIEEEEISSNKSKSLKKSRNKIVEISAKSKSQNLFKSRIENLFGLQKI